MYNLPLLPSPFPVPNKPYGFCGCKAPQKKIKRREVEQSSHSHRELDNQVLTVTFQILSFIGDFVPHSC